MTSEITPNYLEIDYNTLKDRLKEKLQASDAFKDYNYEGANISVLIELFAYVSELNVYYNNKLAKNQFLDTADVYENVHRLANFLGYYPHGYIGASGTLTVEVSGAYSDKLLTIDEWSQFSSSDDVVDDDGNVIKFITTNSVSVSGANGTMTFSLHVKQGEVAKYTDDGTDPHQVDSAFSGSDIVNNKLILPFLDFGYDNDLSDDYQSIKVIVDGNEWTRLSDFYDETSGLTDEDNVYQFNYDKYSRYIVEFNSTRNVPTDANTIEVWLIKSLGEGGDVSAGSITQAVDDELIYNETDGSYISNDYITSITNASAVGGGENPESKDDIKENAKAITHTQYRNVTKLDYQSHLDTNTKVESSIVWGEQEENPGGGNVWDYNKVYITLLPTANPSNWDDYILTNTYTTSNGSTLYIPSSYVTSYKTEISNFLEPRKMLSTYEEYIIPELIYFSFVIGLKIKRTYKYINVLRDLKDKMVYYFNAANREFKETISFKDMIYKMLDTSYISTDDDFELTKGIENVVIRDIKYFNPLSYTWESINAYNGSDYPQWDEDINALWLSNELRDILLDRSQFPFIDINQCEFTQE